MSHRYTCTVCDAPMSPYGVGGTRCERCSEPCSTCAGDVALCAHPLPADGKPNGTFAAWYLRERREQGGAGSYELVLKCYLAGQIPEAAWAEHLQDEVFAAFVQRRMAERWAA